MKIEAQILKKLSSSRFVEQDGWIALPDIIGDGLQNINHKEIIDSLKSLSARNHIIVEYPSKLVSKKLGQVRLKITIDGLNAIRQIPYAKISIICGIIIGIISFALVFYKPSNKKVPSFFTNTLGLKIDTGKINIVVAQFRNNSEVGYNLYKSLKDSLSNEKYAHYFNVIEYTDSLKLPMDEQKLSDALKNSGIDIMFFGTFEPHGTYIQNDTAKIYYKWATPLSVSFGVPSGNLSPQASTILSLNDVKNGKGQNVYNFIINLSLAKLYARKYLDFNDSRKLGNEVLYLDRALSYFYDEHISYVATLGHQLLDKDVLLKCYLKNKSINDPSPVIRAYNAFLLGKMNRDDPAIYMAAKKLHTILPDTKSIIYPMIYKEVIQYLIVYTANQQKFDESENYIADFMRANGDPEIPYLYLAGISGMRYGIDKQIITLANINRLHPEFKLCNRYLAACYYYRGLHNPLKKADLSIAFSTDSNIENDYVNRYEVDTVLVSGEIYIYLQARTPIKE